MDPVTVTYNSETNELTIDSPSVALNSGDVLEWDFQNVPSDCIPGILFNSPLGPFEALQVSAENVIQGRGNLGSEQSYDYTARLFTATGVQATSSLAMVQNQVTTLDTTPSVVVTCTPGADPDTVNITLDSPALGLFEGDTAFWQVSGLGEGFFVTFRFDLQGAESIRGPFQDLVFVRALPGESSGVVRLIGVRFTPPDQEQTEFPYHIEVRDPTGKVLGRKDPQIDNLGPPPQGS